MKRMINVIGKIDDGSQKNNLETILNWISDDEAKIEKMYNERCDLSREQISKLLIQPITININSPGGSVSATQALIDALKESKAKIITKGYGRIASAGLMIFAIGDERYAGKGSMFLYHECTLPSSKENNIELMREIYNPCIDRIYENCIGKERFSKLKEDWKGRDYFFGYQKAKELGFVNKEVL